eukprot:m.30942 g.30942  ORF g.30942 m.30942 type:complete len:310 (-) comp4828_c0_seq1:154-1083(-)
MSAAAHVRSAEEVWAVAKARLGAAWDFMWEPGCTDSELEACEQRLGVKIHPRVREIMSVCSGCSFPRFEEATSSMEVLLRPVTEWLGGKEGLSYNGVSKIDFFKKHCKLKDPDDGEEVGSEEDEGDEGDEGAGAGDVTEDDKGDDGLARSIVVGTSVSGGNEHLMHVVLDSKTGKLYQIDTYDGFSLQPIGLFEDWILRENLSEDGSLLCDHSITEFLNEFRLVANTRTVDSMLDELQPPQSNCLTRTCHQDTEPCEACAARWEAKRAQFCATLASALGKSQKTTNGDDGDDDDDGDDGDDGDDDGDDS